jgi:antitoxin CptB
LAKVSRPEPLASTPRAAYIGRPTGPANADARFPLLDRVMDQADRLNRIKYRAWHRGFREADLIIGPFAEQRVAGFDEGQLDRFEALLEAPDQDLYDWILDRAPTPAEFDTDILALLRAFLVDTQAVATASRGGV